MLISHSDIYPLVNTALLILSLLFLVYAFFFAKQNANLNWAIFYSSLYVVVSLPIVNYLCVKYGMWSFQVYDNSIHLPFDLFFLWLLFWSILPVYFLRGNHVLVLALTIFWIDILLMPELQKAGVLQLGDDWLFGEIALILFVWFPAYMWARFSYTDSYVSVRAFLQTVVVICFLFVAIPYIFELYGLIEAMRTDLDPILLQLTFIFALPALIAVVDLVSKGNGTPFPYDKTQYLVRTGVYAYIQNPIQWSFTMVFIPLAMYHGSAIFLIGSLASVFYVISISNYQEYRDMEKRFGLEWDLYKKQVRKWRFSWKPKAIPQCEIYFDPNCMHCSQIAAWFEKRDAINLSIRSSLKYKNGSILQATYIDNNGLEFKSVTAIACALEHINLAYASLAWFTRLPVIIHLLQAIVNAMDFGNKEETCKID